MPNTYGTDQSAITRHTKQIIRGVSAALTGRERGPDRAVRRNSHDVDHPKAKPWKPLGGVGEGLAHREALLEAAEEQRLQQWRETPAAKVREARKRRDAIAAELQAIATGGPTKPGQLAALRLERSALDRVLDVARNAVRRIDITILRALIKRVDFATGRLFPSLDTIAADAGCSRSSVIDALKRLKHHGFVDWVRRSKATGNDGQFAPQREQTSNAYFFDHQARMARRTWQRFVQILTYKMRRLGSAPPQPRSRSAAARSAGDLAALLGLDVGNLVAAAPSAST